jgi:hypothetical protein
MSVFKEVFSMGNDAFPEAFPTAPKAYDAGGIVIPPPPLEFVQWSDYSDVLWSDGAPMMFSY